MSPRERVRQLSNRSSTWAKTESLKVTPQKTPKCDPLLRLFWASEMSFEMADPGQDPRDAPDIASLWSVLDLTLKDVGLTGIRS